MAGEIRVTGVSQAIKAMRQRAKDDTVKIADGLEKAAKMVYTRAQKYVPVDTGALRESGRVETNNKAGLAAESYVSYGGEAAPYALWVHENLEATHAPPTCARWLAKAVRELRGSITNMMKRQVATETTKTVAGEAVS